ncbi:radical SAM family heme chaperone HemW [Roseivirga sp. BDSF3-8]|uniref:radical SAM family heme chaperone HemW n=1 Tax=Roseivirga sp. BDSF3-8 TaxID=3241598 RepID=UPI00353253CA
MSGIYIHIPFCRKACHYCDFHFSTNLSYVGEMVKALHTELRLQRNFLQDGQVETIYLGGGTPSVLSPADIDSLLSLIYREYEVAGNMEITLEANPDDLDGDYLGNIRAAGINRLSIGTQSFDDRVLKLMNRSHSAAQSISSVELARKAGFDNLNMDLIYAVPSSGLAVWENDLATMIGISPEHISAYHLTIEDKTVFGNWYMKGKLSVPGEEESVSQYQTLVESLEKTGYEHYEVSNFAKKGKKSKHNSAYWKGSYYLGIGPGAHSYDGETRRYNVSHNIKYIKSLGDHKIPSEIEVLTRTNKINEYILTGLRTWRGIDKKVLRENFGYVFETAKISYLNSLVENDLAKWSGGCLKLTDKGLLLADRIAEDLFLEEYD